MNSKVNYGLWVIMMYKVGSTLVTNVPLLSGVDNGGGYAWVGAGSVWEISVSSFSFLF